MPYSPADDAVGLFPDSRQATHCWNDDPAPPPVLVTVPELVELLELAEAPSLAAGCAAAEDPSSDVAGADVATGAAGPAMGVTPERPSGTSTFWFT
jgi:hypothetical protein